METSERTSSQIPLCRDRAPRFLSRLWAGLAWGRGAGSAVGLLSNHLGDRRLHPRRGGLQHVTSLPFSAGTQWDHTQRRWLLPPSAWCRQGARPSLGKAQRRFRSVRLRGVDACSKPRLFGVGLTAHACQCGCPSKGPPGADVASTGNAAPCTGVAYSSLQSLPHQGLL